MKKACVVFLLFFLSSCSSYYYKNQKFNEHFQAGRLDEAYEIITSDKKKHRKDKMLVLLNKGVVSSMLGKFQESNTYLEEAYIIAEDLRKNYLNEGVALLTNPNMVAYKPEDFEFLFIHYYKALNFLRLNEREKALVECKRMDIELNQLNDKYKSDRRYQRDAFIHVLMGLIYDVNGDFNNAFIAYRNAFEIYEQDYQKMFGMSAPQQLKDDLLRSAYLSGLNEEVMYYEKQFGQKFKPGKKSDGELVFLWQNGLGPVKAEWSINFAITRGSGGVFFLNNEHGLSFFFPMSDGEYSNSGLGDLHIVRIAFPKYVERPPLYSSAVLSADGQSYELQKAEDLNQIAFKSLQDRFHIEMGKSLLRFALKKAAELRIRKENQGVGAAVGIFNAISEQADTRHWQTLPHSLYYTRVPMHQGTNEVKLTASGNGNQETTFKYDLQPGQIIIQSFQSLQTTNISF
jgi:uncharacterized protein